MRVRHAIQVSEMNAHFPIFKSDTIYAVTIPMRGIRGRMVFRAGKSLMSLYMGCLSDAHYHPTTFYNKLQSMIGKSKL